MKKKGFTLVELLVVIAIIALLMGILMPALSRVRQIAFRMVCGTNLSGIGKAMLIYANDYNDEFPRAGGVGTATWAKKIPNFAGKTAAEAYVVSGAAKATITSSFYLLVKYTDVTPKSFLCKGDSTAKEFLPGNNVDLITLWDFGVDAINCCSYSYHLPYTTPSYALSTSGDPGMAVASDPSPLSEATNDFSKFDPAGSKELKNYGNSITHQNEGQNVLYMDTHVNFEPVSFCGLNEDNIFTLQVAGGDIRKGVAPIRGKYNPLNRTDSLLVSDEECPNTN